MWHREASLMSCTPQEALRSHILPWRIEERLECIARPFTFRRLGLGPDYGNGTSDTVRSHALPSAAWGLLSAVCLPGVSLSGRAEVASPTPPPPPNTSSPPHPSLRRHSSPPSHLTVRRGQICSVHRRSAPENLPTVPPVVRLRQCVGRGRSGGQRRWAPQGGAWRDWSRC